MISLLIITYFQLFQSYEIKFHNLENKIAYVNGFNKIEDISKREIYHLRCLYKDHPFLIFKNMSPSKVEDFSSFSSLFDDNVDLNKLKEMNILEKHVDNQFKYSSFWDFNLNKEISLSDFPNCVNAFYVNQHTLSYFVSGETIYDSLTDSEKNQAENTIVSYIQNKNNLNIYYPIVFATGKNNSPCILFSELRFSSIVGKSNYNSVKWINNYIMNKINYHKIAVLLEKGDLVIFNNRRFMFENLPPSSDLIKIPTIEHLFGVVPKKITKEMKRYITMTNYWNFFKTNSTFENNKNYIVDCKTSFKNNSKAYEKNPYFYDKF